MFKLSYTSEYKEEVQTLKFKYPIRSTGWHTDVEGNKWDVNSIIRGQIYARQIHVGDHRYSTGYGDTPSGVITTKWVPYNIEVVK